MQQFELSAKISRRDYRQVESALEAEKRMP